MKAKVVVGSGVLLGAMTMFATEAFAQEAAKGPTPAPSTEATPVTAKVEDDAPDHERFVGHFAVGYMGISQIPLGAVAGATGGTATTGTVTAPVIGVRYWLRRNLGIDAGVGFAYQSPGIGGISNDFAGALHGGVPLVFAEGHHYTFQLVPEGTFGFATGSQGPTSYNGFLVNLGARIGAEVHFGFIGVPELALQASVGVYFQYTQGKTSQNNVSTSVDQASFATTLQADPWAIFANSITALYYF